MFNSLTLFLLFAYYIIGIVLILLRKKSRNRLAHFLIVIFIPFFGLFLIFQMNASKQKEKRQLPDWLLQQPKSDVNPLYYRNYAERTRNTVPFQDVLVLNDNHIRRQKLLDLLKKDAKQDIRLLQAALENDDTETSHYAASSILEAKRKVVNTIQQIEGELESQPGEDVTLLIAYSERMKEYIDLEFVDQNTRRKYMYQYSGILAHILQMEGHTSEHFKNKVGNDLALKEYQKAVAYSKKFIEEFPEEEEAYFCSMNVFYVLGDYPQFRNLLGRLKESKIPLSPTGMNRVRYWDRRREDG